MATIGLLPLIPYGDPRLRSVARPVEHFGPQLQQLAVALAATMRASSGAGLAAPQTGQLLQLVVIGGQEDVQAWVNPRWEALSTERHRDWESCLSLPGVAVEVDRFLAIQLHYQDLDGQPQQLQLEGYPARVAQHELDHLQGTLILDRAQPQQRWQAQWQLLQRGPSVLA